MKKETKLVKWGNSQATRIPYEIIEELNLENNQKFEVEIKGDSITLTPIQKRPKDIYELFENWEDDGIRETELDWGHKQGNEFSW